MNLKNTLSSGLAWAENLFRELEAQVQCQGAGETGLACREITYQYRSSFPAYWMRVCSLYVSNALFLLVAYFNRADKKWTVKLIVWLILAPW